MIPNLPIERFRTGATIFSEGDAAGNVYVIISGSVKISQTRNGEETILATLSDDDVFGDMALITNAPRAACAHANANTSCYVINLADYQKQLDDAPPMIQAILKILCQRLREQSQ